jgi:hypothetical protein
VLGAVLVWSYLAPEKSTLTSEAVMSDFSLPKDLQDAARPAPRAKDPNRFYNCAVCGQQVDRVNLDQVYHHDARPHEPLSGESARYDKV